VESHNACGAFDTAAEEIAEAVYVAAGGVDLVEDALFGRGARSQAALLVQGPRVHVHGFVMYSCVAFPREPVPAHPTYAGAMHVVVVDDEPRMVELIIGYLREHDVRATGVHDGPTGLFAARQGDVDAVVLDLMLPGMSGTKVCEQLRREGNDVPILMLTARGAVAERVAGLEAGADDYLVKPFALEELHARLRAIRRRREPDDGRLVIGDIALDEGDRRVWVAEQEVALARREFDMLNSLMSSRGRVVSRARLYDDVWDYEVDIASNTLDVHMSRLRRALAGSGQVSIRTLRGVGYRLELDGR
jgi:two-component system OmpR family response regulator